MERSKLKNYDGMRGLIIKELSDDIIYFGYHKDAEKDYYDKPYFNKNTYAMKLTFTSYKEDNDSYIIDVYRKHKTTYGIVRNKPIFLYMNNTIYSHNKEFKRIPKEVKLLIEDIIKE
jgi:ubiquinone biosynthesis protein COQ9